jgi:uncharacterized protein
MNCPKCNVLLIMSERQEIEIDYCPNCRGIWLDRGELDKIIERSVPQRNINGYSSDHAFDGSCSNRHDDHRYNHHDDDKYRHQGKKNWLSELFD